MKTFTEVYAELRRGNRKQYALLAGCCFFSVLLITAYSCMMRAPTILSILPEGGDSRKQVMMIFVLAVIGCGVFTFSWPLALPAAKSEVNCKRNWA